jgi:hypothetical protein
MLETRQTHWVRVAIDVAGICSKVMDWRTPNPLFRGKFSEDKESAQQK